ncbi:MAG: hypothetical protein ABL308_14180 [Oceanicaulis sp.]
MNKLLMSAAAAALIGAPAFAQSDQQGAEDRQNQRAGQSQQDTRTNNTRGQQNQELQRADEADWNADHDWAGAVVYSEDGETVGTVARVRAGSGRNSEPNAIVVDTEDHLGVGMREIALYGDGATVITGEDLPQGWSFSNGADQAASAESGSEDDGNERRWWNFGRGDDEETEQSGGETASDMDSLTLITVDYTTEDIEDMPEYEMVSTEPARSSGWRSETTDRGGQSGSQDRTGMQERQGADMGSDVETDVETETWMSDDGETGSQTGQRADARQATQNAASNARDAAQDTGEFESANGGEMDENVSDGYDREPRAERGWEGDQNDTATRLQRGDAEDVIEDDAWTDTPDESEQMNAGTSDMDRANRGGQAGDAADADNGATTARDSQSGQTWASGQRGQTGQSTRMSEDSARAGMTGQQQSGQQSAMSGQSDWSTDDDWAGRDAYAADDTRLDRIERVQREEGEALPVAIVILTEEMGRRQVERGDQEWSWNEDSGRVDLGYEDGDAFETDSELWTEEDETGMQTGLEDTTAAATGETGRNYGEDTGNTDQWTDDHAWVDTDVYSRTGERIGDVERVREGAGRTPEAIVVETGGFLDIGGREVELNGSNWRLTEYEGEEVLQVRYEESDIETMREFNEANVSDYPLSDNPFEDDQSEPTEDGTR